MNAAFLLVTSAMLVGQAGGDKKPAPPPAAAAAVASSCGQDNCGCEGFGHRLRDKMRGLFSRDCGDACKPTSCNTHHARTPIFAKSDCCNDACKPKIWNWQPAPRTHSSCATKSCNDGCDGGGFLAKLRGRFHKADSCCDGGCGSTVAVPAKSGEKIEAPKKMPEAPKGDKKPQEVRIENQPAPIAPNAIPVVPTVPTVEITPVPTPIPAPRVESDRRDPF